MPEGIPVVLAPVPPMADGSALSIQDHCGHRNFSFRSSLLRALEQNIHPASELIPLIHRCSTLSFEHHPTRREDQCSSRVSVASLFRVSAPTGSACSVRHPLGYRPGADGLPASQFGSALPLDRLR